jgi:tetratricopeptide (TPR) repeat protein
MSQKETAVNEPVVLETNEAVTKAKDFWARYSKPIIYAGAAIILLAGGWYGYKNFIQLPNEEKAAEMIFPAEKLFNKMTQSGFNKDSINLVLNGGNGIVAGMLKVANTYGGTAAGKRAHYIAGACYLHNKDFNNAIKHLKDFTTKATQVQAAAYLMLGDAHAELKKNDDAFDYYKKAANINSKDEFMAPEAMFKTALFAEHTGKTKEAIQFFKKIKTDYPKNSHANDADKYLARLGVTE